MCKECIPRDWLQDNSLVFLISLILHVFYRSVRNVTSGTEVALEALSQLLVILQLAHENSNPESNDY